MQSNADTILDAISMQKYIKNVNFASIIIEEKELIKFSFRSIGRFSVNDFAKNHFNGGGHINAAGGAFGTKVEEAIEKFKSILPEYQSLLPINKIN